MIVFCSLELLLLPIFDRILSVNFKFGDFYICTKNDKRSSSLMMEVSFIVVAAENHLMLQRCQWHLCSDAIATATAAARLPAITTVDRLYSSIA